MPVASQSAQSVPNSPYPCQRTNSQESSLVTTAMERSRNKSNQLPEACKAKHAVKTHDCVVMRQNNVRGM